MIELELEKYIICWKIQTKYEWNNKKINVAIKMMMIHVQICRLQKEQVGDQWQGDGDQEWSCDIYMASVYRCYSTPFQDHSVLILR